MQDDPRSIYVSRKETQGLLGCSRQVLYRKRDRYQYRPVKRQGGMTFEFLLSSLPPEAQAKYWKAHTPSACDEEQHDTTPVDAVQHALATTHRTNRELGLLRIGVVNATKGMRGKQLEKFVHTWNAEHTDEKTLSVKTVYRWKKTVEEEGLESLVGRYGEKKGISLVFDSVDETDPLSVKQHELLLKCYDIFKRGYLNPNRPSIGKCWERAYEFWKRESGGCEDLFDNSPFPSPPTFFRRLEAKVSKAEIVYAREGETKCKNKFGLFIDRDFSEINPGEVWVADHCQIDVAVLESPVYVLCNFHEAEKRLPLKPTKKTDKSCFPWITAIHCMRTGRFVGWSIHLEPPNSDHIFTAFLHAVSRFGLPKIVYIDNGKDFRSRDFSGGRKYSIDNGSTTSLLGSLGVEVIFANPYNARAKYIERFFRIIKSDFEKTLPGYRGSNIMNRPEKLASETKLCDILHWRDFVELFDSYIENRLNAKPMKDSKHLRGLSPIEAWEQFYNGDGYCPRYVKQDSLLLLCTRVSRSKKLGRNGYYDHQMKRFYFSEWMFSEMGKKVYIRRNPRSWQIAHVFEDGSDKYLGTAELLKTVSGIANSDMDRQKLRDGLALQRKQKKMIKAAASVKPLPVEEYDLTNPEEPLRRGELLDTWAEPVIQQEEMRKREGTHDLAIFRPKELPKKRAIYRSDLEAE